MTEIIAHLASPGQICEQTGMMRRLTEEEQEAHDVVTRKPRHTPSNPANVESAMTAQQRSADEKIITLNRLRGKLGGQNIVLSPP